MLVDITVQEQESSVGPTGPKHLPEGVQRVCLSLASLSFLLWLLNSCAIYNTIRWAGRLGEKYLGR
jgi:hypothetical protein